MDNFEKLGVFYLGRPYDLASKKPGEGWLLYDSSDLVTHAVCVGMTGSGKTGLCIGLLEEAALDGIPALVIDPKGDLSNLLLTFPDLRGGDFRPWINEDEARARGVSSDEYAEQQAALWKKGLAEWGQDGERIRKLKQAADFAVYTPGSNAGLPVSVLKSLDAPPPAVREDSESFREQIGGTVTGLLGLLGIDADPLKSREHILVSTLLSASWQAGLDLDLPTLIAQIQDPPVKRIGVLDVESFFPAKERFGLAMAINNLLASPGFEAWMTGEPLDIGRLLHDASGKPKVSIFSIAHLNDAERMFFVSFLLNRTIGWMRTQSGTTSLRALLYMDEIFGYFPPVANPPSKPPMLTLLKQARAFGLGVVLATQNPVDLDYKGLSNAGTWFIGRLQTERDKARVLDGLEGAAAGTGAKFERASMEQILAGLGSRVFLMNNVHEDGPVVFQTRWTMSYLRGPLTREQVRALMAPRKAAAGGAARGLAQSGDAGAAAAGPGDLATGGAGAGASRPDAARPRGAGEGSAVRSSGEAARRSASAGSGSTMQREPEQVPARATAAPGSGAREFASDAGPRPMLPPGVAQVFITVRGSGARGSALLYRPLIFGEAQVRFFDKKTGVDVTRSEAFVARVSDAPVPVNWDDEGREAGFSGSDLEQSPESGALFEALPGPAAKPASYEAWSQDFAAWLVRTRKLEILKSPGTGQVAARGESERDFRIRLGQSGREQRDGLKEQLRQKYALRIAALAERIRRAEQAVAREAEQASQQKMQTAISLGATLLGSLFGRKTFSAGTVGRATTAARGVGRAMKESQDVGRAQESVEVLKGQLAELEGELQAQTAALAAKIDPLSEALETLTLRAARKDVSVRLVALAWAPHRRDAGGALAPAWQ